MGLRQSWRLIGSTTFRTQNHPGGHSGEGDSTGGPLPQVRDPTSWPTLVIEAGASESWFELHNDMCWWFVASDHKVKTVLLAKFDHRVQIITLKRWEEQQQSPAGATSTRASNRASLEPVLQQTITISRDFTSNQASYRVLSGALVLKFELLFLRDAGPGQGDIVVGIPELEQYAESVWDYA